MEYQKRPNLLDNASSKPSKFRAKIGLKKMMNQEKHTLLIDKLILKH